MYIRKTEKKDLAAIMDIYAAAKEYMHNNGNVHQWGGEYPSAADISEDIEAEISYAVCADDSRICGVFAFAKGPDISYKNICDGAWLNDGEYYVLHRLAAAEHGRGIGRLVIGYCSEKCQNLRIDTHRDNIPMRRLLEKSGFTYCGIINPPYGGERLAFQKCTK